MLFMHYLKIVHKTIKVVAKLQRFSHMFYSKKIIILTFTLRAMIYFKLIFFNVI